MKKRKAYVIINAIVSFLFLLFAIQFVLTVRGAEETGLDTGPYRIAAVICVVILVITELLSFVFYRCHHCGAYLFKTPFYAERCPFCGKKLNEEKGD